MLILKAGGLTHINTVLASIDPNMVQPWYPSPVYAGYAFATPEFLISFALLLTIGLAVAPHVINNVLAAKEDRYFRWSPLIAFVLYVVVMFLVKFAGFAVRVLVQEGQLVLPEVVNKQGFAFVYGIQHAYPVHFSFYALVISVVAMVVVSVLTRRNSDSGLDETMTGLYIQPK